MLRLRIDRFRLLLMPLLVASLLLLAFALAVGAQSGPSITIDSDPSEEVGADETITFTLVASSLAPTITEEFSGSVKATWSENAEFFDASDGFQQAVGDRSLRWDYSSILLILSRPPEFTLKASSSSGEIVVTATLHITQADNTIFSEVTETTSSLIVPSAVEDVVEVSSEVDLSQSSVVISPTGTITAGSPITITVLLSNTGTAPSGDISFVMADDPKLENIGVVLESQQIATQTMVEGNGFGFKLNGPLESQNEARVLLTARVAPDAEGELQISGLISATGTISVPLNAVTVTVVPAMPQLAVRMIDQPESVRAGDQLMMQLALSNTGPVRAENVQVVVRMSPSVALVAEGSAIASQSQSGNELTMLLTRLEAGDSTEIRLTGEVPFTPGSLLVDVNLPDVQAFDPSSELKLSQTIAVQAAPTTTLSPTLTATITAVTEPAPEPSPTSIPPQTPKEPMDTDTLLTIGIIALVVAAGFAVALLFLLRRNRKQKSTPVPPAVQPGTGQPGPAPVPLAPLTPVRSAPGAFIDSVSPVIRWPLGDGTITTIGRAPDCTICIDERYMNWETVSKKHAEIRREGDYYVIYDVSNRNGVYVEGQRTVRNLLRPGWRIGVGGVEFIFRDAATEQ